MSESTLNLNDSTDMPQKCGYVAIIGRPNVGKSTLMNRMLGQKLSITCRKPQTTRHQILGIKTVLNAQLLFVDTPGIHQISHKTDKKLNHWMNRAAKTSIQGVDVILFVLEYPKFTDEDQEILEWLQYQKIPILLVLNKADSKRDLRYQIFLAPIIERVSSLFKGIYQVSAKQGHHIQQLEEGITKYLPEAKFLYSEDEITNRTTRFLVAEMIREKIMRKFGAELPYDVTVEVIHYKVEAVKNRVDISANILVERNSQKSMIIGANGEAIKDIGTKARIDIEKLIEMQVYLQLWVKVKSGWSDDQQALQSLGYY